MRLFLHPVLLLLTAIPLPAAEVAEILPLTDRILMVHFTEGRVEYHRRGQPRGADIVHTHPLDTKKASAPASFTLQSDQDPAYARPLSPLKIARKSKGTEFAWFVDRMVNGFTINDRPDHVKEHWLYLTLPAPLQPGAAYILSAPDLATNGPAWPVVWLPRSTRSEAVHVNTLGHVPDAPEKYGYVYHWMGDGGPLDVRSLEGRPFHLVSTKEDAIAFSGTVRFRKPASNQETQHLSDSPPHGNFLGADVAECDFSSFNHPGTYRLVVEGVGASWPFRIAPDIYRLPYYHVTRALYHNRSGIELAAPHTTFVRPAPHHPRLTPGFAGRLIYTTIRFTEWGSEGGDATKLKAASPGALEDAWGWYQDAGDWDGYYSHLRVPQEMLFAYELAPANFRDGDLNIPESGNGIPDFLDEAAWLPRHAYRLRHELIRKGWGTGGLGLRVAGDAFGSDEKTLPNGTRVGQGSWEDVNRDYAVSGEDPWSTYGYAGVAAHLAYCLQKSGLSDPEGVDWAREAVEAWTWAQKNTRPGDETKPHPSLKEIRAYAAAALFRLTGETSYETQFLADTSEVQAGTYLIDGRRYGPWIYALAGGPTPPREADHARIRAAVLRTADITLLETSERRALRWGGNFSMPMLVGQQTTPWVIEGAIGHALLKNENPEKARRLLGRIYTTCDYFLGTNALNQTWITGVGPRWPRHIFHMDAWYKDGTAGTYHPGLIPYSPWRKENERGRGPWDVDWANPTAYPPIDQWPGNERWFSNRCSPLASEFTVHQNIGPAAALFGYLAGPPEP